MEDNSNKKDNFDEQSLNDFYLQIKGICKKYNVNFARLINEDGEDLLGKGIIYVDEGYSVPLLYDISIEGDDHPWNKKIIDSVRFIGDNLENQNSKLEEELLKINHPFED